MYCTSIERVSVGENLTPDPTYHQYNKRVELDDWMTK